MATLPGYKRLPGRSERFVEIATGKEISRRQYDKLRRGISNEKLAEINKKFHATESFARPARGRASARKLAPEIRAEVVRARREAEEIKKAAERATRESRKIGRQIERIKSRKIRPLPKFSVSWLKPGHMAARRLFSDYGEYLRAFNEMRSSGKVFAYALGVYGVDTRTAAPMAAIVVPMRALDRPLSEKQFYEIMGDWVNEHSYFELVSYLLHVAFKREVYESRAIRHGIKPKYTRQTQK